MKLAALATLIAIGFAQWNSFHPKQQIKQRMVQVYVMAPEGNNLVWERAKD